MRIRELSHLFVWTGLLLAASGCLAADTSDGKYSAEPFVFEHLDSLYTYAADGTGSKRFTIAVRIQSDPALRQLGVVNIPFAGSTEHVEVAYVRVRHPDGTSSETPASQAIEMPTPITTAAPFYSDQKQMQIPVRNLRVGDTLEWQATVVRTKAEAPNQFWGQESMLEAGIALSETVEIHIPKDTYCKFWSPTLQPTDSINGSERILRWQSSQLKLSVGKEADAERDRLKKHILTADEELDQKEGKFPAIAWSSFKSWEAVGAWYHDLENDRVTSDPEIKAKVGEITRGKTTEQQKVEAVYAYVSTQIRYIGVAFGIGRYQPHKAVEVLQNQYGDCKDKHTLLASMLTELGLHPDAVLIGAGIRFNPALPSPASFNHLITTVAVDNTPVWLDSTAEVAPYQVLNYALRDKDALVIHQIASPGPATAQIEKTPAALPFPSLQEMHATGVIDKQGTSTSHIVFATRGDDELLIRSAFRQTSPSQYDELVQRMSQGMGYAGKTSNASVSRPEETASAFTLSYDYKREKSGDWDNLRIVPQVTPILLPRFTDSEPPTQTIWLGVPRVEISKSELKLPDGWSAVLPESIHAKTAYTTCDQTYRLDKGTLYVERRLEVLKKEIPLSDFKTYKKWSEEANLDNEQFIQLTSGSDKTTTFSLMPKGDSKDSSSPDAANPGTSNTKAQKLVYDAYQAVQRHDIETATSKLAEAKSLNPDQAWYWTTYGYIELQRFQLPLAIEDFQKELSRHPEVVEAYAPLANSQRTMNQKTEAIETAKKWAAAQPDSAAPVNMVVGWLMQDDKFVEAADAAEAGVARLPAEQKKNEQLLLLLGKADLKAGRKERGHTTLTALLKATNDPGMMNDCAYELADADLELPLAEATAKSALAKATEKSKSWTLDENPQTLLAQTRRLAANWDTLGWIYFREGKLDQARDYIEAAWRNRQSGEIAGHLAELEVASGNKQAAIHDYELGLATFSSYDAMGVRKAPGAKQKEITERLNRLSPAAVKPASASDRSSDTAIKQALMAIRTISLGPAEGLNGSEEFKLLLSGGKVTKQEKTTQSKEVPGGEERVAKANLAALWPRDSDAQLVRNAMLNCHAQTCELVFEP